VKEKTALRAARTVDFVKSGLLETEKPGERRARRGSDGADEDGSRTHGER
jgi:hypothetical protein